MKLLKVIRRISHIDEGKFGFEFVISNEPEMLRQKALSLCVIEEREIRTWLDFDGDGNDDDEGN